MRIALCGRNLDDLIPLLKSYDIDLVQNNPELVIAYGGDGALLGAERVYPGIAKCAIRDSRSTPKCPKHNESSILKMLFSRKFNKTSLTKITAALDGETVCTGLNDIVINRLIIASALRYRIWLDGQLYAHQIVGDGLVAATPFGSTGYYRSITHSFFRLGLGLAFNNSTEPVNHLVIEEDTQIKLKILRGPAVLIADNDPQERQISTGDIISISKAQSEAYILGLDVFRCPDCYWLRHHQTGGVSNAGQAGIYGLDFGSSNRTG